MIVLLLPPRAFCRSLVGTESLYGTSTFFLPIDKSANAYKMFTASSTASQIKFYKHIHVTQYIEGHYVEEKPAQMQNYHSKSVHNQFEVEAQALAL